MGPDDSLFSLPHGTRPGPYHPEPARPAATTCRAAETYPAGGRTGRTGKVGRGCGGATDVCALSAELLWVTASCLFKLAPALMCGHFSDHFHVHIVNVNNAIVGMAVGQAHLLDDIISLVRTILFLDTYLPDPR